MFCRQHGISVSVFYKIRSLAKARGAEVVVAPPAQRQAVNRTDPAVERAALVIRAELKAQGWDYGPLSVAATMRRRGLRAPSRATLARIFTRHGDVVPQPKKKPRSAFHRFVDPLPNGTWQLDGTTWQLDGDAGSRVIFQVEDDHSRMVMASHVALTENSDDAITVVQQAIFRYGVPVRFLTDNHTALNQHRRGRIAQLEGYLQGLGVRTISGLPYKPTTQGKNERLHQTLQRFLEAHRPVTTTEQLESLLAEFEDHYNSERAHQSLDMAADQTPAEAYHATPAAPPPEPARPTPPTPVSRPTGWADREVHPGGRLSINNYRIYVGRRWTGQTLHILSTVTSTGITIAVFDPDGTHIGTVDAPPQTGYTQFLSLAPSPMTRTRKRRTPETQTPTPR